MKKMKLQFFPFLIIGCISIGACGVSSSVNNEPIKSSSVEETFATGNVAGCVMYSNSTTGTPSYEDPGSLVQLIPLGIKEFPEKYIALEEDYEDYGIYTTTTDSAGDYEFFDIPTGEYRLIIISNNARWSSKQILANFDDIYARVDKLYGEYIGDFVEMACEEKDAMTYFGDNYSIGYNITVKANKTIKKNVTCTNWSKI